MQTDKGGIVIVNIKISLVQLSRWAIKTTVGIELWVAYQVPYCNSAKR